MTQRLWQAAQRHLAGGVNSPVRAFKAVGGEPIFIRRASGPFLWDARNKSYLDYCLSWGAILFGHADPKTVKAIQSQAERGTSFGTVTEYETDLAAAIQRAFPQMERIRFTSSGTEAVMSALRLCRGLTKKNRIVKFEGGYHGHADSLLVKAGSGLATFGLPASQGVPKELARLTSVLPYNLDAEAVRRFFQKHQDIACVIVEPVAGNMGVVPAQTGFLETLRTVTRKQGALLIFDEVITGFRVGWGGAQHLYGVEPDLTILGKIIGGGLPVGAFGGKKSLMNALAPAGGVYQAGTLSGNPLCMAAGLSVLSRLSKSFYRSLEQKSAAFLSEAEGILRKHHPVTTLQRAGSMFTIFFGPAVHNFQDAKRCRLQEFKRFFHRMLDRGVYFPPSPFEAGFLSAAHGTRELTKTLRALAKS